MRTRRTRRLMGMLMAAGMLAGMFTGCAGGQKLSDKFDEAEVREEAKEVIGILNEGDVDTLVDDRWNAMLKSALDKDQVRSQVMPIIARRYPHTRP